MVETRPLRLRLSRFRIIVLGLAATLLAASCGYRPVTGTLPEGYEKVAVPVARNYTSLKGLAAPLTSAVRKRVAEAGVSVDSGHDGALRLEISITMIENDPGMLTVRGDNLDTLDTIRRIHAVVSLVDSRGRTIRGPHNFEVQGRAYSGGNPAADEAMGHRRLKSLLDDLAKAVVSYFLTI